MAGEYVPTVRGAEAKYEQKQKRLIQVNGTPVYAGVPFVLKI